MIRYVLVRHGQTKANVDNAVRDLYICGRSHEIPLTEKGINDAKALSKNQYLSELDGVYSSDNPRAVKTAEHALGHKYEIQKTGLLDERSLGDFEGKNVDDLKNDLVYSEYFTKEALKGFRHGFGPRAPKGENYSDVLKRVEKFFSKFAVKDDKTIAVFSHICAIRCMLMYLCKLDGKEAIKLKIPNCKPIVVEYAESENAFKLMNFSWDELNSRN